MAGIRKVSISHTQLDGLLGNTVILTTPSSLRMQQLLFVLWAMKLSGAVTTAFFEGFANFVMIFSPCDRGRTVCNSLCWAWQTIGDRGRAEKVMLSCWRRIGSDSLFKRFTAMSLMKIFRSPNPWHCLLNVSSNNVFSRTETEKSGQGEQRARTATSMCFNPSQIRMTLSFFIFYFCTKPHPPK